MGLAPEWVTSVCTNSNKKTFFQQISGNNDQKTKAFVAVLGRERGKNFVWQLSFLQHSNKQKNQRRCKNTKRECKQKIRIKTTKNKNKNNKK